MSDRLERLEALRDKVTGWLDGAGSLSTDRAPLVLRLTTILEQIDELEKAQPAAKGTVLDELNQRRSLKKQAPRQGVAAKRQQRR